MVRSRAMARHSCRRKYRISRSVYANVGLRIFPQLFLFEKPPRVFLFEDCSLMRIGLRDGFVIRLIESFSTHAESG
jgi:hypothetical protein